MPSDVKPRMLNGTLRLLGRSGVQATSFSEVIKETGVPRGSIYHHFPNGKNQMIAEALHSIAEGAFDVLDPFAGSPPDKITKEFFKLWRSAFIENRLDSGCPVLAVIVSSDSEELRRRAALVLGGWQRQLSVLLEKGGLTSKQASSFAMLLFASVQGAVVLSRGAASIEPLDVVAARMIEYARFITH